MKIYDFPERVSFSDRFMPWAKDHEEEITKALSDKFSHTYKPQIEYAKDDILNEVGAVLLLVSVLIMALTEFSIGLIAGFVIYLVLSFSAKHCAKKCAIHIFEAITKHDVLEKCFADILNKELAEATNEEERKLCREFYQYAISRTYDVNFKYKK